MRELWRLQVEYEQNLQMYEDGAFLMHIGASSPGPETRSMEYF